MTKILVIEDKADTLESIADILEFGKSEVEAASNGIKGIKLAQKFEPNLILCISFARLRWI